MPTSRLVIVIAALSLTPASQGQWGFESKGGNQSLEVVRTIEPKFPVEMIQRDVKEGRAWVTVLVDAEGRLVDRILTAYTHASFAREAIEALHQWRFKPARRNGQPVSVRTELQFSFKRSGQVVSVDGMQHIRHQFDPKLGHRDVTMAVVEVADLDDPLQIEQRIEAPWPADAPANQRQARATLDFFVDNYGRPRLITVIKSDGEPFSRAAMLALMQWRYRAPLRGGQAINVHVTQEFVFQPPR